jgi:hypothetical protein
MGWSWRRRKPFSRRHRAILFGFALVVLVAMLLLEVFFLLR